VDVLFAGHPLPIVVYDPASNQHLQVNDAAVECFGYRREELLAMRILDLLTPGDAAQVQKILQTDHREKRISGPWHLRCKDGRLLQVEMSSILFQDGGRPAWLVVIRDVSGQLRAERKLRHHSAYLQALIENTPLAIVALDQSNRIKFANSAFEELFGYKQEELLERPLDKVVAPGKLKAEARSLRERLEQIPSGTVRATSRRRRKDGSLVDVAIFGVPLVVDGERQGSFAIYEDITDRLRAEKELRSAEAKYRGIFENAVEGIVQSTPEGRLLSVNPALARMLGFDSPQEMLAGVEDIGREIYVDPTTRERFKQMMAEHGVVERFEYQVRRRDGSVVWHSENSRAVREPGGEILHYEGTIQDVTERKRMELEQQAIFEIIRGVTLTDNLDTLLRLIHQSLRKVIDAENCLVALHDPQKDDFLYPYYVDQRNAAPPAPRHPWRTATGYVFRTGKPCLLTVARRRRLVSRGEIDDSPRSAPAWLGVPLKTPSGTIGVLVVRNYDDPKAYGRRELMLLSSVGHQIALAIERKRAEEGLRERERRLQILLEQLPAVVWATDRQLRFTSALGAHRENLKLRPEDAIGRTVQDYFDSREPASAPLAACQRALAGEAVSFELPWEGRIYDSRVEPLRDAAGRIAGTIGMAFDVTDRRALEEQLRQSQKMEAIGRLAGGIAHDFNNLLMVVRGYSELMLSGTGPDDPNYRSCEQIQKAADRATSLTRQLLAFSRKHVASPSVLDLHSVVTDIEGILHRLIGEDVELLLQTRPGLGQVKADRGQIEQVILNLAVNARDAMPNGGRLILEAAATDLDEDDCRHHPDVAPGRYLMLSVSDTGCGMDAGTQTRIFEPFFTTKPNGTGLGLATVYGVVQQNGGHIRVYSEPDQGTSFKVYFPRLETLPERAEASAAPDEGNGSETILLVEDEAGVRELAREFLERGGYTVLEAPSGAEALCIVREFTRPIHLLVTDVIMPELSGHDLARRVSELRPGIKVLFMSGYTDDAIAQHGVLEQGTFLLQKPFDLHSLRLKVREVLAESAGN
jgi:two-component system cell cycle sensor histidine kinase/response regulator CckA